MAKNDRVLLDGIIDDRVARAIPSVRQDEAIEYLAFEQILKDYDLSPDELLSGSTDGRADGGIDGFYIFVNGRLVQDYDAFNWPKSGIEIQVYVITCKSHDTFSQSVLDKLVATLTDILDFTLSEQKIQDRYSALLLSMRKRLLAVYRKASPKLRTFEFIVCYASRGDTNSIGTEVKSRANQITSMIQDAFGICVVTFRFVGCSELVALHRRSPSYSLSLEFTHDLRSGQRYILLAKLSDYYAFITDGGALRRYLFDSNVRDFMGLNRVNEDIRNTLNSSLSSDFWWLNNGVTILASSAVITGNSIQIQDVQIVNGLQTSESIYRHFKEGGNDPRDRCVLIKVIVYNDDTVRDAIIRATNNQTPVEVQSLHATDKIQRDIEAILSSESIYYERRKNFYLNQGHSPDSIVAPLWLASGAIAILLKAPHKAVKVKSKVMDNPATYGVVFSEQVPINAWVLITRILKQAESELKIIQSRSSLHGKFIRTWRPYVAFSALVVACRSFDFSVNDVIEFDPSAINLEFTRKIVSLVNAKQLSIDHHIQWRSEGRAIDFCHRLSRAFQIPNFEDVLPKLRSYWKTLSPYSQKPSQQVRKSGQIYKASDSSLSPQQVDAVKHLLPKQPWKPGVHLDIARQLDLDSKRVSFIIQTLINDGLFHQQRDGIVYDKDGKILAIDPDRVE